MVYDLSEKTKDKLDLEALESGTKITNYTLYRKKRTFAIISYASMLLLYLFIGYVMGYLSALF